MVWEGGGRGGESSSMGRKEGRPRSSKQQQQQQQWRQQRLVSSSSSSQMWWHCLGRGRGGSSASKHSAMSGLLGAGELGSWHGLELGALWSSASCITPTTWRGKDGWPIDNWKSTWPKWLAPWALTPGAPTWHLRRRTVATAVCVCTQHGMRCAAQRRAGKRRADGHKGIRLPLCCCHSSHPSQLDTWVGHATPCPCHRCGAVRCDYGDSSAWPEHECSGREKA